MCAEHRAQIFRDSRHTLVLALHGEAIKSRFLVSKKVRRIVIPLRVCTVPVRRNCLLTAATVLEGVVVVDKRLKARARESRRDDDQRQHAQSHEVGPHASPPVVPLARQVRSATSASLLSSNIQKAPSPIFNTFPPPITHSL